MSLEEKLIEMVKMHPVLYDKSTKVQNLPETTAKIWRSISQQLGVEEIKCRKRWKNLRDSYRKDVKAAGKPNKAPWKYAALMSFMDNYPPAPSNKHHSVNTSSSSYPPSASKNPSNNSYPPQPLTAMPQDDSKHWFYPTSGLNFANHGLTAQNNPSVPLQLFAAATTNVQNAMMSLQHHGSPLVPTPPQGQQHVPPSQQQSPTEIDMERFIDDIKNNPALYNPSDPGYIDQALKTRLWEGVAASHHMTLQECKKKWKSVRDSYTRALKSTGTVRWPQLDFLKPHLKVMWQTGENDNENAAATTTPTTTKTSKADSSYENSSSNATTNHHHSNNHNNHSSAAASLAEQQQKLYYDSFKMLTSAGGVPTGASNGNTGAYNSLQQQLQQQRTAAATINPTDEDAMFCDSILAKLRRLPQHKKYDKKIKILQVLCDVEELNN